MADHLINLVAKIHNEYQKQLESCLELQNLNITQALLIHAHECGWNQAQL